MNLQEHFNKELFDNYLPEVRDYIQTLEGQQRDNATAITLRRAMSNGKSVAELLDWELMMFQDCLIKDLKRKEATA